MKTKQTKLPSMKKVLETIRKEDIWKNDFWDYKEAVENQHKPKENDG